MRCKRTLPLIVALMAVFAIAAGAGKTSANYNLTATLVNNDTNENPFAVRSDGSSSAVYDPDHDSSILSYLYSDPSCTRCGTTAYEWALDLSQSSRSFLLTLTPVNGSPAGPFSGTMAFNGKLRSRCFDPANNVYSWPTIKTSDSNCAMRVDFTYNTVNYILLMGPTESGTGTATVTCTNWDSSTAMCSTWKDVPTAAVPNATVAHLYSAGKNGALTLVGSYALSFDMQLMHP